MNDEQIEQIETDAPVIEAEQDAPEQEFNGEPVRQEAPKPEWSDEDAEEAKAFGWKPPEEWVGDKPAGYIDDPRRYLERAENFRPFKALKERMEAKETEAAERLRKLEAMNDRAMQHQRAQFERDMQAIAKQQREAVENADIETWDSLEKQKASMRPPEEPQATPTVHPYVAEYEQKNDWVKNPMLRKQGAELINLAGLNNAPVEKQLEYAESEMRRMYPGYFASPETPPAPKPAIQQRVDGGGLAGGIGKGNPFDKLPPEAKAQFKRDVDAGLFKNDDAGKRAWANDYNAA